MVFEPVGWDLRKKKLDKVILANRGGKPMPHWTLHDLRRTCATGLAQLGVLPHVIECILNHLSGFRSGVAAIYNRNRYLPEMRAGLCKWADYVESQAEAHNVCKIPVTPDRAASSHEITAPLVAMKHLTSSRLQRHDRPIANGRIDTITPLDKR
jgi:hypothetical protein